MRAHIEDTFLENNEPDFQRRELEKIQQGTYEDAREYSQHYLKALNRAYTNAQLQDPVHLERVIRCYIRGLHSGDVREKVYDSLPATLQQAMTFAHTFAHSKTMRAERNGPKLEYQPFPPEGPRRKEEPMDVGYLTQAMKTPEAVQKPPESAQKAGDPDERVDGLERKLKGMQKQITSLTKGQEALNKGQGTLTKGLDAMRSDIKRLVEMGTYRAPAGGQQPPPQNYQEQQPGRPDNRKWNDQGVPYCLRCGGLGHLGRECTGLTAQTSRRDQGN